MREITEVFLIRHSEQLRIQTNGNIHEDSQTSNEKIILSINGEQKAEELSNRNELQNIDAIWSSNYARAIGTAKYIAQNNNIQIFIDERFNERRLRRFRSIKTIGKIQIQLFYSRTNVK